MENEQKQQEQEIDLIELFYKVIVHWRWFLIAIAVALTGAYIYVHITTPVYQASASVVIKDSLEALPECGYVVVENAIAALQCPIWRQQKLR